MLCVTGMLVSAFVSSLCLFVHQISDHFDGFLYVYACFCDIVIGFVIMLVNILVIGKERSIACRGEQGQHR